jgi:hypothetical protein
LVWDPGGQKTSDDTEYQTEHQLVEYDIAEQGAITSQET